MTARHPIRRTVAIVALALLGFAANAPASTVTVGSPLTQSFTPTKINGVGTVINTSFPEPGALVASPISGTIIRWRVSGAEGGPFKLRVLRPAGPETYTGAGTSAPASPSGTGVQVFATSVPIQAGDVVGFDNSNKEGDVIGTISPLPGAGFAAWAPPLPDGATLEATEAKGGLEIAFSADVQPLPVITSIAPKTGSIKGKTKVRITGSDFTGATVVSFGATPTTSFTVDSDTQITAKAPPAKNPGEVDVVVTTLAGTTSAGPGDRFTYQACKVPKVTGQKLKKAKRRLRRAHCKPGKVKLTRGASRATGRVVKQKPKPGKVRAPGAEVKLTLG